MARRSKSGSSDARRLKKASGQSGKATIQPKSLNPDDQLILKNSIHLSQHIDSETNHVNITVALSTVSGLFAHTDESAAKTKQGMEKLIHDGPLDTNQKLIDAIKIRIPNDHYPSSYFPDFLDSVMDALSSGPDTEEKNLRLVKCLQMKPISFLCLGRHYLQYKSPFAALKNPFPQEIFVTIRGNFTLTRIQLKTF